MKFDELNDDNFLLFAIKYYDNPQCSTKDDFYEDLKRFKYIKRLLKKYIKTGELKTHLLLNHIIIINNLFGPDARVTLLLFKIQREYWETLKAFLLFLNILREDELIDVKAKQEVVEVLRKL